MKKIHTYLMLTVTVIIASIIVFFVLNNYEKQKSELATYTDLKNSELIEKGWLPGFLPKSSKKIIEKHNLDTNEVEASFEYISSDVQSVESKCSTKIVIENGFEYRCKYEDSFMSIRLLNNGKGFVKSSPFKENIK